MAVKTPDFTLAGRVALVTGAARGIGLAIAQALASAGCAVGIQDLDEAEARRQAEAINAAAASEAAAPVGPSATAGAAVAESAATAAAAAGSPRRAIALGGDITDLSLPAKLVAETRRQLGGLHILVNNASIQARLHWTTVDQRDFDRTMHANVLFPVLLTQQAVPTFRAQRWGRIIHIGSIQQLRGNQHMLAYAASKAALANMTPAMARDLGPDGITVNLLAPGYFHTIRNEEQLGTPDGRARAARHLPLRRVGEPADAAGLALLLCSDAGSYITGQSIFVDGGMSIG